MSESDGRRPGSGYGLAERVRAVVPSAATLGGLFFGFLSITLTVRGHFESAAWMVFFAACADTVDGGIARGIGATSPFGQQLDSLSDLVCAGVAPAVLVYRVYFEGWGTWGVVPAYAWVALVALRLARFGSGARGDSLFFAGVPCPIAANIICQYFVFSRATWRDDGHPWVVVLLIAGLGALMMSRVPYWKSATLMPREFFRHVYGVGTFAMVVAAIWLPDQAIFAVTAFSVVSALVFHGAHRLSSRARLAARGAGARAWEATS